MIVGGVDVMYPEPPELIVIAVTTPLMFTTAVAVAVVPPAGDAMVTSGGLVGE